MGVSVTATSRFAAIADALGEQARAIAEESARDLQGEIQRNILAQGLVDSTAYLQSWGSAPEQTGDYEYTVSSDSAYGPRLNYGFSGEDALGRTYNQPARPHVEPAEASVQPRHDERIARIWDRAN
jgi:hypothetical protein